MSKLVRLKGKPGMAQRFSHKDIVFRREMGWYVVSDEMADYLENQTLVDYSDPDSGSPFDVATEEEARALEDKETQKLHDSQLRGGTLVGPVFRVDDAVATDGHRLPLRRTDPRSVVAAGMVTPNSSGRYGEKGVRDIDAALRSGEVKSPAVAPTVSLPPGTVVVAGPHEEKKEERREKKHRPPEGLRDDGREARLTSGQELTSNESFKVGEDVVATSAAPGMVEAGRRGQVPIEDTHKNDEDQKSRKHK